LLLNQAISQHIFATIGSRAGEGGLDRSIPCFS